jgi:hypothetical protein
MKQAKALRLGLSRTGINDVLLNAGWSSKQIRCLV